MRVSLNTKREVYIIACASGSSVQLPVEYCEIHSLLVTILDIAVHNILCIFQYYIWYMSQETLRNPRNFTEHLHRFRADSITAELQYYYRGACLPVLLNDICCPQICPYPVTVFVLRGTSPLYMNMAHNAHKLRTGSYVRTYIKLYAVCLVSTYAGVHCLCAAFDNSQLRTVPLRWFYPFDYYKSTTLPTILQIQYDDSTVIISHTSADAFDNSDCADALLQIRRHPLTTPRTPFGDSADILNDAVEKLRITNVVNPRILYSFL